MDIHITVEWVDIIGYADVTSEVQDHAAYNEKDDYAFFL